MSYPWCHDLYSIIFLLDAWYISILILWRCGGHTRKIVIFILVHWRNICIKICGKRQLIIDGWGCWKFISIQYNFIYIIRFLNVNISTILILHSQSGYSRKIAVSGDVIFRFLRKFDFTLLIICGIYYGRLYPRRGKW